MNCNLARQLIDEYLDHSLSPRERRQMEAHLSACPSCASELREQTAFEQRLRRVLGGVVQGRDLAPAASGRMVHQVQSGLHQAIWANRARSASHWFASVVAMALVLLGVNSMLERIPRSLGLAPVTLAPARQFVFRPQRIVDIQLDSGRGLEPEPTAVEMEEELSLLLGYGSIYVEPRPLPPGQPFTITFGLENNLPYVLGSSRFDLEISGPTGLYKFPLTVQGPFPAGAISMVRITTDVLTQPARDKYLIEPTDIFSAPGVYVLRFTFPSPAVARER